MHSLVDDHSRLAYSELHNNEKAATVTGFVERGLAFYTAHGIKPSRLLSDNAFVYRKNRSLHELLTREAIKHKFIRPRRPQTNGKVERFQQTLKREWGLGQTYRSSDHRAQALSHWLKHHNEHETPQPRPQRPEAGHLGAKAPGRTGSSSGSRSRRR